MNDSDGSRPASATGDSTPTEVADPVKRLRMENFFTQLPRDCNLSVFKLVNKKALQELECVSKQVHEIAIDQSLSRIKIKGSITIRERPDGLQKFEFEEDGVVRQRPSLCYEIARGQQLGSRFIEPEPDYDFFGSYGLSYVARPIPEHMIESMALLAKNHAFNVIELVGFHVDNNFIDKFLPLLSGNYEFKDRLIFWHVQFDDSFDTAKFGYFLRSAKLSSISFDCLRLSDGIEEAFLGIFDENFFTGFAESCTEAGGTPRFSMLFDEFKTPSHWIASRSFLPILCRFQDFSLRSVKVHPQHVVQLITMRLDDGDTYSNCSEIGLSLTEELTDDHLKQIDSKKYIYSQNEVWKIGTASVCQINRIHSSGRLIVGLSFNIGDLSEPDSESGSDDESDSDPDSDDEAGSVAGSEADSDEVNDPDDEQDAGSNDVDEVEVPAMV